MKLEEIQLIALGKLMVLIAWEDGEYDKKEKAAIRFFYRMGGRLTRRQIAEINIYTEYELTQTEKTSIIENGCKLLGGLEDLTSVYWNLRKIVRTDEIMSPAKKEAYQKICAAIKKYSEDLKKEKESGVLGMIQKGLTRTPFRATRAPFDHSHSDHSDSSRIPSNGRERLLEDYLNNALFFKVCHHLSQSAMTLDCDKPQLRKICHAAALMADVTNSDGVISDKEIKEFEADLMKLYQVDKVASEAIVYFAVHMPEELYSLQQTCRRFIHSSNAAERREFIKFLLYIAASDGYVDRVELDKIVEITQALGMSDQYAISQLIEVKKQRNVASVV
jgi:uncharacterized tellurite resistance protein B-like protein